MKKKLFTCFVCKRRLSTALLRKRGKTKRGTYWDLCVECSAAYARKVHEEMDKARWKGGFFCPRCESENRVDDGSYPLRRVWCDDCSFTFTLMLEAA